MSEKISGFYMKKISVWNPEKIYIKKNINIFACLVVSGDNMKVYICEKSCCPAVETIGDEVLIGEDTNIVRLKKNEWNKLVEKIQSGELGSI